MEKLNILSIDFDFFQNVSSEVMLSCYPDGIDLPTELTVMTWASHYAHSETGKKLLEITPKTEMIEELKSIIQKNCNKYTPFMAANSHVHIYDFIKEQIDVHKSKDVYIANLDMHHDCFNQDTKLDCGNWVGYAMKDFPNCQVQWIANPISKEIYNFDSSKFLPMETNFSTIENKHFDAIFLCRSDTWLPPHLDESFDDLLYYLARRFPNNRVEGCVQEPRDIIEHIEIEKKLRQMCAKRKAE